MVTTLFPFLAVLGSTSNFDFPPEELDKFAQDHNLNGGSARASTEDSDDDDYNENLVYVSSPKVCPVGCSATLRGDICFVSQRLPHMLCTSTCMDCCHVFTAWLQAIFLCIAVVPVVPKASKDCNTCGWPSHHLLKYLVSISKGLTFCAVYQSTMPFGLKTMPSDIKYRQACEWGY